MKTTIPIRPQKPLPIAEIHPGDPLCKIAEDIRGEIAEQAYRLFRAAGCTHGHDVEDWLHAESQILKPMNLELIENDSSLTLRAELRGFAPEDITIGAEPHRLLIRACHTQKSEKHSPKTSQENAVLQAFRSVELPAEIDPRRTHASFSNGVVEVTLLKILGEKSPLAYSQTA